MCGALEAESDFDYLTLSSWAKRRIYSLLYIDSSSLPSSEWRWFCHCEER